MPLTLTVGLFFILPPGSELLEFNKNNVNIIFNYMWDSSTKIVSGLKSWIKKDEKINLIIVRISYSTTVQFLWPIKCDWVCCFNWIFTEFVQIKKDSYNGFVKKLKSLLLLQIKCKSHDSFCYVKSNKIRLYLGS